MQRRPDLKAAKDAAVPEATAIGIGVLTLNVNGERGERERERRGQRNGGLGELQQIWEVEEV